MTDGLQEWDEPVPETVRDHANAAHGDHSRDDRDSDMSETVSAKEMAKLESMPDVEFEEARLHAMVEHHQGAIEMANTEIASGERDRAGAIDCRRRSCRDRQDATDAGS